MVLAPLLLILFKDGKLLTKYSPWSGKEGGPQFKLPRSLHNCLADSAIRSYKQICVSVQWAVQDFRYPFLQVHSLGLPNPTLCKVARRHLVFSQIPQKVSGSQYDRMVSFSGYSAARMKLNIYFIVELGNKMVLYSIVSVLVSTYGVQNIK